MTAPRATGFVFCCDRCANLYRTEPSWAFCPICPNCLIALRRTETREHTTFTTAREIQSAWRHRTFQQWNSQITA